MVDAWVEVAFTSVGRVVGGHEDDGRYRVDRGACNC
jgi:hypothetical protein